MMNYSVSTLMNRILILGLIMPVATSIIFVKNFENNIADFQSAYEFFAWFGSFFLMYPAINSTASSIEVSRFQLGLFCFLYILTIVGTFFYYKFLCTLTPSSGDKYYLSGPVRLKSKAAIKHLRKSIKNITGDKTLKIHPKLRIPNKLEALNIFVFGMQGAGKSTLIKQWLVDIVGRPEETCFIYDEKGEYRALLGGADIVEIDADDNSSFFWDIGADVRSKQDAELVAESMIESIGDANDFFVLSARQVLLGVFYHLVDTKNPIWSWAEISAALFSDDESLKELLEVSYPAAARLISPDSKSTQSIRSVISAQLGWISTMNLKSGQKQWSITNWLNDSHSREHVVFQPSNLRRAKSRSMINALMSVISQRVLARKDEDSEKLWLVVDELGNLPRSTSLENWLTLSRSKGGRTIAGTQSLSQIRSVYGPENADTILSLFGIIVAMRLGPTGLSAETASKALGRWREKVATESEQKDGSITLNYSIEERPIVSTEELVHLPLANKQGVEGFLLIGGTNAIYQLRWPFPSPLNPVVIDLIHQIDNKPLSFSELKKGNLTKNRLNRRSNQTLKARGTR